MKRLLTQVVNISRFHRFLSGVMDENVRREHLEWKRIARVLNVADEPSSIKRIENESGEHSYMITALYSRLMVVESVRIKNSQKNSQFRRDFSAFQTSSYDRSSIFCFCIIVVVVVLQSRLKLSRIIFNLGRLGKVRLISNSQSWLKVFLLTYFSCFACTWIYFCSSSTFLSPLTFTAVEPSPVNRWRL